VLINFDFISSTITLQEIRSNGYFSINEISLDKIDQIKLRRFRNFIIKISNTHTTYQGLWISLIIFYLGLKSFALDRKVVKIISLVVILVFTLWLYLISARMPFLALVFSLILIIVIFSKLSLKKKVLVSLIPLFVLGVLLSFKNPFSIRVKEYYNTGFSILRESSLASEFNSSNVRNGVYYCDIKLIKEAPFFGVGLGDVQDKLNRCYNDSIGAKVYTWHKYNTHNQYAFFWIASGVLGLISLLSLIFMNFFNSVKKNNILLFYQTSITAIVFFTENLLQRSDGVFFYCFFISLLFFNKLKK
jgi:O-antigen ligase